MHRFLSLMLCILLMTACGTHANSIVETSANTVDEGLIKKGIALYQENYCGLCHTLTIANTRGTFGPSHNDAVESATRILKSDRYLGEATSPSEYIKESILYPDLFYTPGFEATHHHMPSFAHLPKADVEAIVYMLVYQNFYGYSDQIEE